MEKFSLTALAREQLGRARTAKSGRSATTVFGGHEHTLRQTVVALTEGHTPLGRGGAGRRGLRASTRLAALSA